MQQRELPSLIIFSAVAFSFPGVGPSEEIQTTLTISTFLFAILAGFFISRLNTRYNKVRELVADEDSLFISLYKTSKIYGKSFSEKIKSIIDRYYITAYDFIQYTIKFNEIYVSEIWKEIRGMKKNRDDSVYEVLLDDMTELEKCRDTSEAITEEMLGMGQWVVMVLLSGIILFSMFYLKTDEIYSQVITIMLSTVLVLVLLIVRDLQNFMLGGKILVDESGQRVFESIGLPRYYNASHLKKGIVKIPNHVREYRLGSHEPGSHTFNIRLVKNKNYNGK